MKPFCCSPEEHQVYFKACFSPVKNNQQLFQLEGLT